jgi:hypothetical protein
MGLNMFVYGVYCGLLGVYWCLMGFNMFLLWGLMGVCNWGFNGVLMGFNAGLDVNGVHQRNGVVQRKRNE